MNHQELPLMPYYLVRWEIDLHADTPQEAAAKARRIQLDQTINAAAFEIFDGHTGGRIAEVDLAEKTES